MLGEIKFSLLRIKKDCFENGGGKLIEMFADSYTHVCSTSDSYLMGQQSLATDWLGSFFETS